MGGEIESISEPQFEKEFQVRRSDIDTNDHINNTKYVEWVLEAIPQDVYDKFCLSTFFLLLSKLCNHGKYYNLLCM